MAGIAAGALVAEQVVSTGVEAGVAVSIARPTQPLKASLSQFATSTDSSLALARSSHTVTVIGDKAYIFGGEQADGTLCSTDVHAISLPSASTTPDARAEYACYPAFPVKDSASGDLVVPAPRKGHAACARGKFVVIHGGSDASGTPIDEGDGACCLWLWDSDTLRWRRIMLAATQLGSSMAPRAGHAIFVHEAEDYLVLHGGRTAAGLTGDTWLYDFLMVRWTQLPTCPVAPSSSAFVDVDDTLYSISSESELSGAIHTLVLGARPTRRSAPKTPQWERVAFPSNPLAAPGPKARVGGALIPISTGFGRHYLAYLFGRVGIPGKENEEHPFCSDVWALQVPSQTFSFAGVKDAIRDKLPADVESGAYTWAEIEIVPGEQVEHAGKVHPGPRGFFGASPCLDGKGVVFWGGVSADGRQAGDGWLLKIQ